MKRGRFDAHVRSNLSQRMDEVLDSMIIEGRSTLGALPGKSPASALDVQVRLACCLDDHAEADRLVALRYAWRGYAVDEELGKLRSERRPSPDSSTLLAYRNSRLIGTIRLGLAGDSALLAHKVNPAIVDSITRGGKRVIELTRLAVQDTVDSTAVLAQLFRDAYCIGRLVHGATDALIEVNPRHAAFYARVFGFVRLGDELLCSRVNAPAVLMHLDVAQLDLRLALAGQTQRFETQAA
jgi:hypothetical protein